MSHTLAHPSVGFLSVVVVVVVVVVYICIYMYTCPYSHCIVTVYYVLFGDKDLWPNSIEVPWFKRCTKL